MDREIALDVFRYDPESGKLYWVDNIPRKYFSNDGTWKQINSRFGGTEAGSPDTGGYLQVRWKNKAYRVHRIIWLMVHGEWPAKTLDHKNHNRQDNRLENLGHVSLITNVTYKRTNKSGHPCIFFSERNGKRPWCVQIYSKGKYLTQKAFTSLEEAIEHRDEVRRTHGLPPISATREDSNQ